MNAPVTGQTRSVSSSPLTPTVGAEIPGVDLSRPVPDDMISAIRHALLDWKVLFFRDQDITTEQHLAFARSFGELEVHPFAPHKPGYPEVLAITHDARAAGRENTWHSDVTWRRTRRWVRSCGPWRSRRSAATPCSPTWPPPMTG